MDREGYDQKLLIDENAEENADVTAELEEGIGDTELMLLLLLVLPSSVKRGEEEEEIGAEEGGTGN